MNKKQREQLEELTLRVDTLEEELEKVIKSLNALANQIFMEKDRQKELPKAKTLGDI